MPELDKAERATRGGTERRSYPVQLEVRAAGDAGGPTVVEGYASVTEAPYEMWDLFGCYTEVIRSGAFARTLGANPQVQLLLNHGGLSMAYTRAGTLQLSEDTTGLHMRAEVNPTRRDVSDLLAALNDGNVDEMSFAFRVPEGRSVWSPDYDQRDITEVDMHRGDVSVVNFGANPATSVAAMRALDLDRMDDAGARALYERLGRRFILPVPEIPALIPAPAVEARAEVIVVDTDDDDDDDTATCPSCGAANAADAAYCDQCGASMTTTAGQLDEHTPTETRRRLALTLRELAADDDAILRTLVTV